jgi:hypothetical protein
MTSTVTGESLQFASVKFQSCLELYPDWPAKAARKNDLAKRVPPCANGRGPGQPAPGGDGHRALREFDLELALDFDI